MKNYFHRLSVLFIAILIFGFNIYSYSSDIFRIKPQILKGNCKSLVIRCYCNMDSSDIARGWKRCYYDDWDSSFYNTNGMVLTSYRFDSEWKMDSTFFEYDSLSNRISYKSYDSNGKLRNHTKVIYKYDNKNRIIEVSSESTGYGLINKYNVIRSKSKYDVDGNKTEYCLIDANGKESSKTSYIYNERGKIIEETHTSTQTPFVDTEYYEYDEHGNRTFWEHYNKGKLIVRILTKYDDRNNMIEYVEYDTRNGQLMFVFKSIIEYDQSNNQTKVSTYNEKDVLLSSVNYKYRYDQKGNWIECISYDIRNIPGQKIVRKIEYY